MAYHGRLKRSRNRHLYSLWQHYIQLPLQSSQTKDTLAQPIIDNLVKLGQNLRKAAPDRAAHTPDKVLSILTEELKKVHGLGAVMNPWIDMDGK